MIDQYVRFDPGRYEIRVDELVDAVGLIEPQKVKQLGTFIQAYIDHRSDASANTLKKFRQTRAQLIAHFGADRPLKSITRSDAAAWQRVMAETRSKITLINYFGPARLFFEAAFRANLITRNTFDDQQPEARLKNRGQLASHIRQIINSWNPTHLESARTKVLARSERAPQACDVEVIPEGTLRRHFEDVYVPMEMFACLQTSREHTRGAIRRFDDYCDRYVALAELDDTIAARFFRYLLEEGYPATSVNNFRRRIFAVWRHAHRLNLCTRTPGVKKLKEHREEPDAWTVDEFGRMLAASATLPDDGLYGDIKTSVWWSAILNCAYWTGLRVGSILKIKRCDVDFATGWLTVPAGNIKTRRAKRCRLHPVAIEAIEKVLTGSAGKRALLFDPHPGRSALRRPFDRILTLAGVPLSTRRGMNRFHKIRRTAATAAYQAGGINAAAALLDHSNTQITYEHYIDGRAIKDNDATLVLPVPQLKLA